MAKKNKAALTTFSESDKIIRGSYANQHELNKAIERFLDREPNPDDENEMEIEIEDGGMEDASQFTDEEKIFISKYTGAGGLAKKGASGKGLLYEYYTPDKVVKKMWALVQKYGYVSGPI